METKNTELADKLDKLELIATEYLKKE
jgi:hypothetical protein